MPRTAHDDRQSGLSMILATLTVIDGGFRAVSAQTFTGCGIGPPGASPRAGALVRVQPVDPAKVEAGDIVLAKVSGTVYLHLVSAVDHARGRVQISNYRGRVNGWTAHARAYGICVAVDGVQRPRVEGKLRAAQSET